MQMLDGVAARADVIGPRVIAGHWPFVGSDYRRLLVVGQALAGWDDPKSSALWTPAAAATERGRHTVFKATRSWAQSAKEPMTVPLQTRGSSAFWSLASRTVRLLEPAGQREWYSRCAWWNLFPLAWGDTNRSPWFDGLWAAQYPFLRQLFWEVVDWLEPTRIVILAGKQFWSQTAERLGLDSLTRRQRPLVASGVLNGRVIAWTYHPGGRLKGVSRPAFAAAIADAVRALEASR